MLIDLGYAREEPAATEILPGRVGHWWRRLSAHARRRHANAAGLALLVLASTAGAAAPIEPFRPVVAAPLGSQGTFALTADTLYALEVAPTGNRLRAYRLADGALLWTVERPGSAGPDDRQHLVVERGTAAVETAPEDSFGTVTAYDRGTGDVRWRRDGSIIGVTEGGLWLVETPVLSASPVQPCAGAGCEPELPRDVAAVDPATGVAGWQVRIPPVEGGHTSFDWYSPRLHRLAMVDATGQLTVRDLTSGEVTTGPGLPADPRRFHLELVDQLVLVRYEATVPGEEVAAYDVQTLRPRWTMTIEAGGGIFISCGPVLCQSGPSGTVGIDPATGWTLWRLPNRPIGAVVADGSLLAYLNNSSDLSYQNVWLVDPRTGLVRRTLPGWTPVGDLWSVDSDLLVMRSKPLGAHAWFALMQFRTGEVRILGTLPRLWQGCQGSAGARPTWIACLLTTNQVQVWRVTGYP